MSYKIEGRDLVISGWETGISDNPYLGLNDMRGCNIVSIPGEASVSFASTKISTAGTACIGSIVSADASTDIVTVTVSAGTITTGMAMVFTGASLPTGLTAGTTYWIIRLSDTTFTCYSDPRLTTLIDITATGTGTFANTEIGSVKYFEKENGIALDANGRAWDNAYDGSTYIYMGNPVRSGKTNGNGLFKYRGYLFIISDSQFDYTAIGAYGVANTISWVTEWSPLTGTTAANTAVLNSAISGAFTIHEAVVGIDDVVYICDGHYLNSLREKSGQTFDPTNTATYVWNKQALALPGYETAQCLAELGVTLLIGGAYNYIYPWNRTSTTFNDRLFIAENGCVKMVTVNTNTYIFTGKRGRIYVTNGSQAQFYKKLPDHISGSPEPVYTWKYAAFNKNQLYAGVEVTNNAGTAITSYSGLWAIDVTSDALRVPILMSLSTATVTAIFANANNNSGYSLNVAWRSPGGTYYGIDTTTSVPYTDYGPYIITDLIPVGTILARKTFEQVEFKLAAPMTSGEGIKISYRENLSDAFTQIGESLDGNIISDIYTVNFQNLQWLQFKIEMKSTATTASYVRLKEIRIR